MSRTAICDDGVVLLLAVYQELVALPILLDDHRVLRIPMVIPVGRRVLLLVPHVYFVLEFPGLGRLHRDVRLVGWPML